MSSGSTSTDRPALPEPLRTLRGIDGEGRAEQLTLFELGPEDEEVLKGYRPVAEATVDRIVSDFYAHLLSFPELERLLRAEPGRIAKLQGLQRGYFLSLSEGRFDADYFESRLRVGDQCPVVGRHQLGHLARELALLSP